jgi:hypothetical protein
MSYNGSGTFQINTSGQPVVTGTVISSTAFNALTADLATGLSTAITKDGQTATTVRIPFAQGINSSLTTDTSSGSTGSIYTAGGIGITKGLFVGGTATFSATPVFSALTASSAVATDASKNLVSVTNTGTGSNVLATSPTLVTPVLGVATATSINKVAFTAPATSATLTIANGATLATSGAYALTLTATAATNVTFPTTGTLATLAGSEAFTNKTLTAPTIASANITTALTLTGASGTSGQVLTSAGSGNVPTWATPAPITSGTAVASTSGTSIDFTGLPSTAKRITVMFSGVSTSGTSIVQIQIGTSGGVQTTGYSSGAWLANTSNGNSTSAFLISNGGDAAYIRDGMACLTLLNSATGLWTFNSVFSGSTSGINSIGGGSKTLSGTLDRVRITTANGTDTFDAGSINILYE